MINLKHRAWHKIYKKFYEVMIVDFDKELVTLKGVSELVPFNCVEFFRKEGHRDSEGEYIYEGDIIELINEVGWLIRAVCKFGTIKRKMYTGVDVYITGFYFEDIKRMRQTLPVVRNYLGISDYEIFVIIGNIKENENLLEVANE